MSFYAEFKIIKVVFLFLMQTKEVCIYLNLSHFTGECNLAYVMYPNAQRSSWVHFYTHRCTQTSSISALQWLGKSLIQFGDQFAVV